MKVGAPSAPLVLSAGQLGEQDGLDDGQDLLCGGGVLIPIAVVAPIVDVDADVGFGEGLARRRELHNVDEFRDAGCHFEEFNYCDF